ncbi:MAG: ubiquinone/menaquinone biosynthesis methyltransferase [Actinomycetota bacterium]|nr:ubiquinone/menaquinone biosynthesis methyltransferase [Actinomycetota bacterium]
MPPTAPGVTEPRAGRLEERQVRAMFDRIAGVYDRMNAVMSAGLDRRWRARAADLATLRPGDRALDVATGTGDLALELAGRVGREGEVVGCDFSEEMLARARDKAAAAPAPVRFEWANALSLPYDSNSFAAATVGFGARNFADLGRGIAEMARVVRPGGRVVVLEITTPQRPPLAWFYALWFDRAVPALGRLAGAIVAAGGRTGDAGSAATIEDAYSYLPSSVKRFPGPPELARTMAGCGLVDIRWIVTAGGIIALHAGTVAA